MTFEIHWDWLEKRGESVRSHDKTWARLRVVLNGNVLTTVQQKSERVTRETVAGPLMPLAEWIASNWWFLGEETPLDPRVDSARQTKSGPRRSWFRRHNWLFAREGFPLPDLSIARIDDDLSLIVASADPETARDDYPVRFIESGEGIVAVDQVRAALGALVDAVLSRVQDERDADVVALRERWDEIRNMPSEDRTLRECAAAAGLDGDDPHEVSDELAAGLVFGLSKLPAGLRRDVLDAHPDKESIQPLAAQIASLRSRSESGATDSLGSARRELNRVLSSTAPAHEVGWKLAKEFRRSVLGIDAMTSSAELREQLDRERFLSVAPQPVELADKTVRAWIAADTDDSAPCVFAKMSERAATFAYTTAVGLALLAPRERLATRAVTRPQRIARAFSTELLCPVDWLRSKVTSDYVTNEQLDRWAQERGVYREPIVHQIKNHDLAIIEPD
jgi:hypothetical protein